MTHLLTPEKYHVITVLVAGG